MERLSAKTRVTYLAWRKVFKLFGSTTPQLKALHFMTTVLKDLIHGAGGNAIRQMALTPKNVAPAVMQEIFPHLLCFLVAMETTPSPPALGTLLNFTTGSDILPECLEVSFTSMDSYLRRVIAHVCGPLLLCL